MNHLFQTKNQYFYLFIFLLTITKENPFQRDCQPWGQGGTEVFWLWTAIIIAGPSQTTHLQVRDKHIMKKRKKQTAADKWIWKKSVNKSGGQQNTQKWNNSFVIHLFTKSLMHVGFIFRNQHFICLVFLI